MVNMALVFIGFTLLVLALLALSTVYYLPRVLTEDHDHDHGGDHEGEPPGDGGQPS